MAVELTTLQQVLDWCGCGLGLLGAYTLASRLSISRYGWLLFFAANLAYIALARELGVKGMLAQQVGFLGSSALGIYRSFFDRRRTQNASNLGDPVLQQAREISARLAAVPKSYLEEVPDDLARLIRQSQRLHPQAADPRVTLRVAASRRR